MKRSPAPARPHAGTTRRAAGRRWRAGLIGLEATVLVAVAVLGGLIVPHNPRTVVGPPDHPPDARFWFGTDSSGLDVFSRTIVAIRYDLLIGIGAALIATFVGVTIGLFIGMRESRRGLAGMLARAPGRLIDLSQAIPAMVIGLALVAALGSTVPVLIAILAVVFFPNQARLVRTEVLRVRTEAYLDTARMAGLREFDLTVRHVLPNAVWPALENMIILFGAAIFTTAALGFLGVGLAPPTPEWGSMISIGASDAAVGRWWPAFFPAAAIVVAVLAVTSIGRGILKSPSRGS
jgi:peptide/nickel transport system permease protein